MAVDMRGVGGVAVAVQLVGLCVHRQGVGIVHGLCSSAAPEDRAETTLLAVTGGVVIGGRGAEALFLLAVAAETELGQGGDDEKDAASGC